MTKKKTRRSLRPRELTQWAKRATAALDQSGSMIGVWDDRPEKSEQYWAFAIQIGHCLMAGKPLLLIAPIGREVPERLKAAASAVEYYIDGNGASVQDACKRAFESIGVFVKH